MRTWTGRALLASLALSLLVSAVACAGNAMRQGQAADDLRDYDLAVASYMRALREHPNNRDAQLSLDRAKLRAADAHLVRGRRLAAQGRYDDALVELQVASEMNPASGDIDAELRRVRLTLRTQVNQPDGGATPLQTLLSRTIDLAPAGYEIPDLTLPSQITTGQESTIRTVYLTLARLGNLSVTFDAQFRDRPAPPSSLTGMTLKQALDAVAASSATFYQVTTPGTIVVVPDTPAKRREYAEEVVRQFTVQNADLKEVVDALRTVADARYIAPVTGTNMILVRDSPERIRVIGRFLSAFDKAKPQIVVDVEILEVDRTRLREYGLQIASPGSPGLDGAADVNQPNGVSLQDLRTLTQASVPMTGIPALYYRLLKTDANTRTLANPHIRMTDGIPSRANFGQEVPVPTLRVTPIAQGGANVLPQTQFDYKNIGVNIEITPRTHPNDEVTLALNVQLNSLGAPGFDGLPTFGNRNVTTTIRLRDGETNILAGLIRDDERTERQTIPGLGDVPVLGQLFARNHKEAEQTDVVIMLTPHIVRGLDLTEDDLRPLRLPRDGGASILTDGGPFVPVPPIVIPAPSVTPTTPVPGTPSPPAPPAR